ncbi:hypothetical protein H0H87_011978 [Tephrocybe sp. NHM501043]|nr:hypothetical protein H0H87_011978 [Tephrocybe sp. NHM501043]
MSGPITSAQPSGKVLIPNGKTHAAPLIVASQKPATSTPPSLPTSYYDTFLSDAARKRGPSPIRDLFPLEHIPGIISLLAGKPNPDVFPFESLQEVETDAEGISSNALRSILENWPVGKPKPRVLYTVPYGCNPTGMTASLERRREVLRLAGEHDFIILEDDPYYYLYYGSAVPPPSYFSLEREAPEVGRVLRFDSLSKIMSAGIRIGFASGPKPLLQAIDRHVCGDICFDRKYGFPPSYMTYPDGLVESPNAFADAGDCVENPGIVGLRGLQKTHGEGL